MAGYGDAALLLPAAGRCDVAGSGGLATQADRPKIGEKFVRYYGETTARRAEKEKRHNRNRLQRFALPLLGSNQDSPDPESGVLPVTPRGS